MKRILPLLAAIVLLPGILGAQNAASTSLAATPETPEHLAARLKWFQEARFGLFIHWGIYAVPAGEWQGQKVRGIGEWIMKCAAIPIADYKAFAPQFTASKYDPKAWAALAKEAGMKYVVITTKHHDGFTLFDSAVSDWSAVKASGAKRDLLAPLAEAVRAEGLKFGCYYSQAQDWTHPGGAIQGVKEGNKEGWDPAQKGSFDAYLKTIALPQVKEILTRYQPDVIWWDTPFNMNESRAKPLADTLRELAPNIISNNRLGGGYKGDTKTPEQSIPPRGYPGEFFEVCMTMNGTWGYKKNDNNWKSVREIIRHLSDISSKGGNFLLNVGPNAEGEIPKASIERLQAVGRWMAIYSEAIYATEASPFARRMPWGRVTQKKDSKGGVTLYLHVWDWPQDGKLLLPTLKETPTAGRVLKGGAPVTCKTIEEGLLVNLPGTATDEDVSVVALDFAGPVTVTQNGFITPDKDGRITLNATDADTYGTYGGNMATAWKDGEAYLSNWHDEGWRVEYSIKTPAAGKWNVSAEIVAQKPAKLTVTPAKKGTMPVTTEIPVTGSENTWKTVELGIIELPAGETSIELKPVKESWNAINMRHVWLAPAK